MAWTVPFLALLSFLEHIAAQQTAFITDLPAYVSLSHCAANGLHAEAYFFTAAMCTEAHIAPDLASCICLNKDKSTQASRGISFFVSANCQSSASVELSVSAALNVLSIYCHPEANAPAITTGTSPTSPVLSNSAAGAPISTLTTASSTTLRGSSLQASVFVTPISSISSTPTTMAFSTQASVSVTPTSGHNVSHGTELCSVPTLSSVSADAVVTEFAILGCSNERPECCAYDAQDITRDGLPIGFGTLTRCPVEYFRTSDGCCPSYVITTS